MTTETNECSICYEPLLDKDIVTLNCKHKFHFSCILQNIKMDNTSCPYCRDNIKEAADILQSKLNFTADSIEKICNKLEEAIRNM